MMIVMQNVFISWMLVGGQEAAREEAARGVLWTSRMLQRARTRGIDLQGVRTIPTGLCMLRSASCIRRRDQSAPVSENPAQGRPA